ncbi:MAG: hypothetical protein A4E60_03508 [Syntrophorhabdus sp. PtaB.Bin047]|nr:MAG: hypothetical protein A4E60_03508 [Syntrophorhabdus sp. PtaB.Bin047]
MFFIVRLKVRRIVAGLAPLPAMVFAIHRSRSKALMLIQTCPPTTSSYRAMRSAFWGVRAMPFVRMRVLSPRLRRTSNISERCL